MFLAHRKGFDCSTLFASVTAKGNPHPDFTYLREASDNELLGLIQGSGYQTRIDIAKFDDVIKFICQKACSDINYILRSIEAPCFARISGIQIIVELRGDVKESVYLGPAEAVAYIGQLIEKYSQPKEMEVDLSPAASVAYIPLLIETKLMVEYLTNEPAEWVHCFDPDELMEFSKKIMTSSGEEEQQAMIHEWRETAIVRQSGVLDPYLE